MVVFGTDWDEYLPHLLFAYHTKPHHLTGELPFYCLYGNFSRPYFSPYRVLEMHPNDLSVQPVNHPNKHSIWVTHDQVTTNNLSKRIAWPTVIEEGTFYKAISSRTNPHRALDHMHLFMILHYVLQRGFITLILIISAIIVYIIGMVTCSYNLHNNSMATPVLKWFVLKDQGSLCCHNLGRKAQYCSLILHFVPAQLARTFVCSGPMHLAIVLVVMYISLFGIMIISNC